MDRTVLLRDAVDKLLNGGQVDGVLALRAAWPGSTPHLFHAGDDLSDLALWPKYQLPKVLDALLTANESVRLGMVCRGCEERGLIELAKHNQVDLGRVTLIFLACTAEERDQCRCAWPYPSRIDVGEKVEGIADQLVAEHEKLSLPSGPSSGNSSLRAASNATPAGPRAHSAFAKPACWRTTCGSRAESWLRLSHPIT